MSETQMIHKAVGELIPYENNPRHNEGAIDAVAKSIEQFGFKVPIVIDTNNVIVAGHTRLRAAMKLGLETVPCIVADDLTEEQVKAFRLADNKVGELATWDFAKLSEELEELTTFNMEDFGFDFGLSDSFFRDEEEPVGLEEGYEEPEKHLLRCPSCNHIDSKERFRPA